LRQEAGKNLQPVDISLLRFQMSWAPGINGILERGRGLLVQGVLILKKFLM
jgi:hypothetical protein